ncbi:MAG: hypothetical protein A2V70_10245 [Planctomycetes bacterium RBG_13_63_9]|nr:MAG: hypothetical protein A2V70_10245 [Planctomycetes bacterium RBG_13_63_9]
MRSAVRLLGTVLSTVLLAAMGLEAGAQYTDSPTISREDAIKAAYLCNFTRYVTWPEGTFSGEGQPFVIGLFGQNAIIPYLRKAASKIKAPERQMVVREFEKPEQYVPCQILFIGASATESDRKEILRRVGKSSTLVVGETPRFAGDGGIICFYVDNNRVRFEINPGAAKQRGLKISSKLLALAKVVPVE